MRQRRPDLDHPLHREIEPAAEIALHRAGEDADHRRDAGERQPEQNRDAKAVDEPGDDVVPVLIGAEPERFEPAARTRDGRGVLDLLLLERGAALGVGQHPGRRRRQRRRRVEDRGRIGEADRRPDHPAMRLDLVGDEGVAKIRARLEAAELILRIVEEDGKEDLAFVGGDQRPVVGDELGEQRSDEQDQKDPRTTMRRACCGGNCRGGAGSSARARDAARSSRALSPAARSPSLRRAEGWRPAASPGCGAVSEGRSEAVRIDQAHTSRVSKSMRGSIQV